MALSGGERLALVAAALVAVAVPLWLLTHTALPPPDAAPPAMLAPRVPAPATAVFVRDLFAPVAAAEAAPADAPELIGIAGRIGRDAVALVRIGGGGRTLAIGESIDGWRLESVAIDAASFTRGGRRVRVSLPIGEHQ